MNRKKISLGSVHKTLIKIIFIIKHELFGLFDIWQESVPQKLSLSLDITLYAYITKQMCSSVHVYSLNVSMLVVD